MGVLGRARRALLSGKYRITGHADEEMEYDGLSREDVVHVIQTGRVSRRFTEDPRGPRYEVAGRARDGRAAFAVVRFLPGGILRIVTAYAERE